MLALEMIRASLILAASGVILGAALADKWGRVFDGHELFLDLNDHGPSDENPGGRKFLHKQYMDNDFEEEHNPGMPMKAYRSRAPVKRIEHTADMNPATKLKDASGFDRILKTSKYGSRSSEPRVIQRREMNGE